METSTCNVEKLFEMLKIGLEKPKTGFLGILLRWMKMPLCQNKKHAKAGS